MAYVTHGSYRPYRIARERAAPLSIGAVAAALSTAAAAVLIMALAFDVGATTSSGKGDRLAPPDPIATASVPGAGAYVHDAARRTTTIARDATIPLGPESPLANAVE